MGSPYVGTLTLLVCVRGCELVLHWKQDTRTLGVCSLLSIWTARVNAPTHRCLLMLIVAALGDYSALAKACRVPSDHRKIIPVLLGCPKWFRSFQWLHLWMTLGSLTTAAVVTWKHLQKGLPQRKEQESQGDQSKTTMKQTTQLAASPVMNWRRTGSGTVLLLLLEPHEHLILAWANQVLESLPAKRGRMV